MQGRNLITGFLMVLVFVLTGAAEVFSFSSSEQDCSKCHSLSKEEAKDLLSGLLPNVGVIDIRPSQMKGLWEVSVETAGKKGVAYIDYSKDKVVFGEILKIKTQESYTRKRVSELNRVDFSQIPLDDALVMGDPKAAHKVVVFDDPD